jgi:hypothetical protein
MQKFNIAVAIIALVALCSCSGQTNTEVLDQKHTAVVTSIIDGWNANAVALNFAPAYSEYTLGQLYKGSNFEADMDAMEVALSIYYGIPRAGINGESTMGFAHFDDETIDVE